MFSFDDGEYGPVVSDGQTLYLTGGVTVVAFKPVEIGNFKYKTKKGQKGIVPPHQQRKARKQARKRASSRRRSEQSQDAPPDEAPASGDGSNAGQLGQVASGRGPAGATRCARARVPAGPAPTLRRTQVDGR